MSNIYYENRIAELEEENAWLREKEDKNKRRYRRTCDVVGAWEDLQDAMNKFREVHGAEDA